MQSAIVFASETYEGIEVATKGYGAEEIVAFRELVEQHLIDLGATKAELITETTAIMVTQQLKVGAAEGLGAREVARNIRNLWKEIGLNGATYGTNRAERIARTELVGATNYGSLVGAQQTGLELNKVWLSSRDGVVRKAHTAMEGEKTRKDSIFSNGLRYPGDPNGRAEDVINCRCTMFFEVVR